MVFIPIRSWPSTHNHFIVSRIISFMSRIASTGHVDVAFYTHRDFPAQWAIVLAENPLFEGRIWRGNAAETTNGWCASWTPCEWSPVDGGCLNPPVALFSQPTTQHDISIAVTCPWKS
jgi:hypothetical protein